MPLKPITTRFPEEQVTFIAKYASTNNILPSEALREIIDMIQEPGVYSFMTANIRKDTYRLIQYKDERVTFMIKKGRSWAFSHALSMPDFKKQFYLLGTEFYAFSASDTLPLDAVLLS